MAGKMLGRMPFCYTELNTCSAGCNEAALDRPWQLGPHYILRGGGIHIQSYIWVHDLSTILLDMLMETSKMQVLKVIFWTAKWISSEIRAPFQEAEMPIMVMADIKGLLFIEYCWTYFPLDSLVSVVQSIHCFIPRLMDFRNIRKKIPKDMWEKITGINERLR